MRTIFHITTRIVVFARSTLLWVWAGSEIYAPCITKVFRDEIKEFFGVGDGRNDMGEDFEGIILKELNLSLIMMTRSLMKWNLRTREVGW